MASAGGSYLVGDWRGRIDVADVMTVQLPKLERCQGLGCRTLLRRFNRGVLCAVCAGRAQRRKAKQRELRVARKESQP